MRENIFLVFCVTYERNDYNFSITRVERREEGKKLDVYLFGGKYCGARVDGTGYVYGAGELACAYDVTGRADGIACDC